MGVHHYHLTVLPRAVDRFDPDERYWMPQPPESFLSELRRLLPDRKSWGSTEEYVSSGDWCSDLRFWYTDDSRHQIEGIDFRYSPVADNIELLNSFIGCISRHGFLVYSRESERTLEPRLADVVEDLKTTPAFRFLSDPEGTLLEGARKSALRRS